MFEVVSEPGAAVHALAVDVDVIDNLRARGDGELAHHALAGADDQELDITVYSSDGKRSPGRLSRQGPPVLRWCLYEAGKLSARATAPDHAYYAKVKHRIDGKRATLAEARKITRVAYHILTELGDDAFTPSPVPAPA